MYAVRIDMDGDGYVFKVQPSEDGIEMVALDSTPGIIALVQARNPGEAAARAWDKAWHMQDGQAAQLNPDLDAFLRQLRQTKGPLIPEPFTGSATWQPLPKQCDGVILIDGSPGLTCDKPAGHPPPCFTAVGGGGPTKP
jgi:hypothetical protein